MSRITWVHTILIGGVLWILIAVGLFFAVLKPLNESNAALQAQIAGVEGTQTSIDNRNFAWNQHDAAVQALNEARVRRAGKERQLAVLEARRRLPRNQEIDLRDGTDQQIIQHTLARWLQLPRVVVQRMEDYAQARARRRNVRVTTVFTAPAPSTVPSAIPRDIIAWTLGNMTVEGRFEDVMAWAKDWNNAPLLASVDGLKCSLSGRGGRVESPCTLTVFIFPTGQAVQSPGAAVGGAAMGGMDMGGGAAMMGSGGTPADGGVMDSTSDSANGP